MSCPPGMSDTTGSRHSHSSVCLLHKDLQTSFGFYDLRPAGFIISYCDPRRIISSVLQLRQAAKQNRSCLLFSYISYNSTHNIHSINDIFTSPPAFLPQKRHEPGRILPSSNQLLNEYILPCISKSVIMKFRSCHYLCSQIDFLSGICYPQCTKQKNFNRKDRLS